MTPHDPEPIDVYQWLDWHLDRLEKLEKLVADWPGERAATLRTYYAVERTYLEVARVSVDQLLDAVDRRDESPRIFLTMILKAGWEAGVNDASSRWLRSGAVTKAIRQKNAIKKAQVVSAEKRRARTDEKLGGLSKVARSQKEEALIAGITRQAIYQAKKRRTPK